MKLATKQGQKALAQSDSKPYTNPTPRRAGGEPLPLWLTGGARPWVDCCV